LTPIIALVTVQIWNVPQKHEAGGASDGEERTGIAWTSTATSVEGDECDIGWICATGRRL
jgi:hypothetical protein